MLKAHTFFQVCQCNSCPFCKCCFAQSDMLEKILAKLVSRILRKRLTCFNDVDFLYANRTFARLEIICTTLIYE